MNRSSRLAKLLREAGFSVRGGDSPGPAGFAAELCLSDGSQVTIDLPEPFHLSRFNPEALGLAVVDAQGYTRASWGLAGRLACFDPLCNVLRSELAPLLNGSMRSLGAGWYLDGYRFFVSGGKRAEAGETLILVVNAYEEESARRTSVVAVREADALKRFGRVLNMHHTLHSLCVAAVHELSAIADLAGALLWTLDGDRKALVLTASTGASRVASSALGTLALEGNPTCIAEMVAMSAQPFFLDDVRDHLMTRELEAKFCYLQPGGVSVHPLYIAGNVIGVLELLGKEGDPEFFEFHELFQTLAENLALAVNSAMLFESVEKMANDDALTGIANHRTLQQFLQSRLAEARRTKGQIGLLMIDVDHFRTFNEEEGHDVGDMVLKHVAEILRESVRPYDLAARYGGEEFTVVLPGSGAEATLSTADRIRRHVEAMPIRTNGGRVRNVTVSVGCSIFPEHAGDASSLLQSADSALYQAKREGRNRVVAFSRVPEGTGAEAHLLEPILMKLGNRSRSGIEKRVAKLRPLLDALAARLALTASQSAMLEALAALHFACSRARAETRAKFLKDLQAYEPIRALMPSYEALGERFDGAGKKGMAGPRIPLLARALMAALAYEAKGPEGIEQDAGRFDPEVARALLQYREAA
jgi:diguanylate cyclase (GGDEF)-like protein